MSAPYDPNQPLFSIHVPKCAGTSLRQTLNGWFGEANVLPHYRDREHGNLPRKWELRPGVCVHGHFNRKRDFGVWDYYPEARQFITFLRDPFETHLSLYFYMKLLNNERDFPEGRMKFRERCPNIEAFFELLFSEPDLPWGQSFLAYLPMALTEENYREVLREQFIHVGLSEAMNESLNILAYKLGKPALPSAPWANKAPYDETVNPRIHELHKERYALEHTVHAFVREVHEEEMKEYNCS